MLVADAATRLAGDAPHENCCHVTGHCVGNSDATAEPDIECQSPSTLVEDAATTVGRGNECCRCPPSDDGLAIATHGVCVASDGHDAGLVDRRNMCTNVMQYASCGDKNAILRCARNPSLVGCHACSAADYESAAAAFESLEFSDGANECTAQDLCMDVGVDGENMCTFLRWESEQVCVARVKTSDSVPETPLDQICHEPCKLQCPCGSSEIFYGDEGVGLDKVHIIVCVVTLFFLVQLRCWALAQWSGVLYQNCSSTPYDELEGDAVDRSAAGQRKREKEDRARVLQCTAGHLSGEA